MPWEDILKSLAENCSDKDLIQLPRPEERVKYMLRLHLQVAGVDFKKYLLRLRAAIAYATLLCITQTFVKRLPLATARTLRLPLPLSFLQ